MEQYDYIEDYRGCTIYQDMDNGAFLAYDHNDPDKPVARGFILRTLKHDIDRYVGSTK